MDATAMERVWTKWTLFLFWEGEIAGFGVLSNTISGNRVKLGSAEESVGLELSKAFGMPSTRDPATNRLWRGGSSAWGAPVLSSHCCPPHHHTSHMEPGNCPMA